MIIAYAILSVCILAGPGTAHPPSEIVITVNMGVLMIDAPHAVSDGKTHYIKEFLVTVDGNPIYRLMPYFQGDNSRASAALPLFSLVKKGSVVEVEAECSKFGKLKKSLVME